jgi:hypothetical protein
MYVDGELSTTDKEMVEAFTQQHPDLQEELAMLQQAVLLPEKDLVFTNKNLLFKHVGNEITTNNYEEKFLLYVDDELAINEKAEIETFVLQHPKLQQDFTILQQTKLPVEVIACPNKEGLYKKEEKRKVFYMRWSAMAAAAVVMGLIATVYFIAPSGKNDIKPSLANNTNTPDKPAKEAMQNNTRVTPKMPAVIEPNKEAMVLLASTKKTATSKTVVTNVVVISKLELAVTNPTTKKPFKDGAQEFLENPDNNIASTVTNSTTNRNTNSTAKNEVIDEPSPSLPKVINALNTTNIAAQQVVYKELDTNSDDKSLLVGSIEINKDKLRGLLRKASKLFGNKQKSDDDTNSSLATNK